MLSVSLPKGNRRFGSLRIFLDYQAIPLPESQDRRQVPVMPSDIPGPPVSHREVLEALVAQEGHVSFVNVLILYFSLLGVLLGSIAQSSSARA